MIRKFVIEFTVDDADIKFAQEQEFKERLDADDPEDGITAPEDVEFTPVDIIGANWSTGDEFMTLVVTRAEEVK
jgi:hypothetical protein